MEPPFKERGGGVGHFTSPDSLSHCKGKEVMPAHCCEGRIRCGVLTVHPQEPKHMQVELVLKLSEAVCSKLYSESNS